MPQTARPKRIAITGSTGFVGSTIARVLSDVGHDVVGLTRREVGPLLWETRVTDFSSLSALGAALDDVDAVVHLAAETGDQQDDPRDGE